MNDTNRDAQPKSLKPKDIARHEETTEVILNQARCKETGYAPSKRDLGTALSLTLQSARSPHSAARNPRALDDSTAEWARIYVTQKLKPGLPPSEARRDVRNLLAWDPVKTDGALLESAWSLSDCHGFS